MQRRVAQNGNGTAVHAQQVILPHSYGVVEQSNLSDGSLKAGWSDRLRSQFRKTELCRFHRRGRCRAGLQCHFAHGPEDLQELPDLRKTSLCEAFLRGECPRSAAECRFAHGKKDLRMTEAFKQWNRMQSSAAWQGPEGQPHPLTGSDWSSQSPTPVHDVEPARVPFPKGLWPDAPLELGGTSDTLDLDLHGETLPTGPCVRMDLRRRRIDQPLHRPLRGSLDEPPLQGSLALPVSGREKRMQNGMSYTLHPGEYDLPVKPNLPAFHHLDVAQALTGSQLLASLPKDELVMLVSQMLADRGGL